jgi:hypothetical protein
VIGTGQWFLCGSTEWLGVLPEDVELGKAGDLTAQFPKLADDVKRFPLPVK